MKTQHKFGLFRGAWSLVILGGLAGCCGSIDCDCDVSSSSDVVFFADQDSLRGGFRKAELRGAYAVRYAPPGFAGPADTAKLNLASTAFNSHYISLMALRWLPRPGAQPAPQAFTGYNYRFVLPKVNRIYDVSNLDVTTELTSGCCACPVNTRRRFMLNGNLVIAEGGASETALRH